MLSSSGAGGPEAAPARSPCKPPLQAAPPWSRSSPSATMVSGSVDWPASSTKTCENQPFGFGRPDFRACRGGRKGGTDASSARLLSPAWQTTPEIHPALIEMAQGQREQVQEFSGKNLTRVKLNRLLPVSDLLPFACILTPNRCGFPEWHGVEISGPLGTCFATAAPLHGARRNRSGLGSQGSRVPPGPLPRASGSWATWCAHAQVETTTLNFRSSWAEGITKAWASKRA